MTFLLIDNINDMKNFIDSLLPYPTWIRILLICCVLIIFSIYLFYPKRKIGKVDISSLKIAYVEVDKNIYQLGIIVEVTNLTDKPLSVDKVSFIGERIEMISRGVYRIPLIDNQVVPLILLEKEIEIKIIGEAYLSSGEKKTY